MGSFGRREKGMWWVVVKGKVMLTQPPKFYTSPYIHEVPIVFHDFVVNMLDVDDDENCGFMSVASLLGMGNKCGLKCGKQ